MQVTIYTKTENLMFCQQRKLLDQAIPAANHSQDSKEELAGISRLGCELHTALKHLQPTGGNEMVRGFFGEEKKMQPAHSVPGKCAENNDRAFFSSSSLLSWPARSNHTSID